MRSVVAFTDGRIHVTLFEGAFDLAALTENEKRLYEQMLSIFMVGGLWQLEELGQNEGSSALPRWRCFDEPLETIFVDMCRRLALEERGMSHLVEEFEPWRPDESRRMFESLTCYRPTRANPAMAA